MLSQEMINGLQSLAKVELKSVLLYLKMSYVFDSYGLKNLAEFYRAEYKDELEHHKKVSDFMDSIGVEIEVNSEDITLPKDWIKGHFMDTVDDLMNEVTSIYSKVKEMTYEEDDTVKSALIMRFCSTMIESQVEGTIVYTGIIDEVEPMYGDMKGLKLFDMQFEQEK